MKRTFSTTNLGESTFNMENINQSTKLQTEDMAV